ncbi:hypothetical protein MTR67_001799 [Solanum verrucosum]|uniref:Fungal lipase-type domain-containing protein n=1 Tax=Solanum verrucosum TaxID=315347 RepID=A0AAF0PNW3_SOLVR|nr:hypothetical protein MTR67_001799 [Solanum verrucosum]
MQDCSTWIIPEASRTERDTLRCHENELMGTRLGCWNRWAVAHDFPWSSGFCISGLAKKTKNEAGVVLAQTMQDCSTWIIPEASLTERDTLRCHENELMGSRLGCWNRWAVARDFPWSSGFCISGLVKKTKNEARVVLVFGLAVRMIDPIDPLLQAELIHYGDMLQACHNAFDLDRSFTSGEKHGYDVSSYIYYKCLTHSIWPSNLSHQANWIGYVAVSNDEYSAHLGCRDITIAWRKTTKVVEMIADIMDLQRPARDYNMSSRDPIIKIEAGLLNIYTRKHDQCNVCKLSAREQVLNEVKRLIDRYSNEELSITIAGHSLGGGLAMGQELGILDSNNGLKH